VVISTPSPSSRTLCTHSLVRVCGEVGRPFSLFLFHLPFVPSPPTVLATYLCPCLEGMTLYYFDQPALDDAALLGDQRLYIHRSHHLQPRSCSCNSHPYTDQYLHTRFSCYPLLLGSGYLLLPTLLSRPSFMSASFSKFLHCQLFSAAHSRFPSFKITCCICMATQGPSPLSPCLNRIVYYT